MIPDITLFVVDAAPLITLAAAASLQYLLYPQLPVLIPDAVFYEATNAAGKLGGQEIIAWYRDNSGSVRVEPTEIFQREAALLEIQGGRLSRDVGERAALELIRTYALADGEVALLLSDDRDAQRLSIVEPDKMILLTTWDYLRQLEEAQRIQSAAATMDAARQAGRNPAQRDLWSGHDPDVREAVQRIVGRPKPR